MLRLTERPLCLAETHPEAEKDYPVLFNEFCTTWYKPCPENLNAEIERVKGLGLRYFELDDGWFTALGDWDSIRTERTPADSARSSSPSTAPESGSKSLGIPLIGANTAFQIPMSRNQIRAMVREYHSPEYLCCLLVSGFLGRLCLSGEPSKLTEENFAVVREGGLFVSGLTDFCGLAVVTKV